DPLMTAARRREAPRATLGLRPGLAAADHRPARGAPLRLTPTDPRQAPGAPGVRRADADGGVAPRAAGDAPARRASTAGRVALLAQASPRVPHEGRRKVMGLADLVLRPSEPLAQLGHLDARLLLS